MRSVFVPAWIGLSVKKSGNLHSTGYVCPFLSCAAIKSANTVSVRFYASLVLTDA
ncbi:hypothetical protein J21TS3_06480 [Paenibacillus cookii]|uniref:Uncharacterized protein n=1 Tax=Paenibacillus cookii TaxID=157839 RepID=A0ABQ4LRE9_9BACL|nr:hypothetical protein CM49_02009 [Paenibacillus sp. P1XP2]GIO65827.1 hypothetical protein J21TS3_06480 [Paenibacillus cookii]